MLVPYIELPLPSRNNLLEVPEIVVGPTPTPNLSIDSIVQYMSKYASNSPRRVSACMIPYRPSIM
jgi:hypothetical protein